MTGNNHDPHRYCIIHGHFYQPPRENPWIETVEVQSSAAPAHDWNERVYSECYRPNSSSRILDAKGMIVDINNNYRSLSFNFGPTLFRWLEDKHPTIAQRIIDADRESFARLDGHGNAIAQVFNHIIMPLASRRDRLTQIRWAKSFFRERFGRETEGLWLSETAINMDTVIDCIDEGIKFVVLSPTQAESVCKLNGDGVWHPVDDGSIDPRRPYRIYPETQDGTRLSGHLDVFFFNEALSRGVSFEGLLNDAAFLGNRLSTCLDEKPVESQTVILATDGETFGHHKPFGDMCLAYLFTKTAQELGLTIVNFGYVLAHNPPTWEVKLKNAFADGSAWSCSHGTGRWFRDCGCQTGGLPSWNQKWRTPLRSAFNELQVRVDAVYESFFSPLVKDIWALRDDLAILGDRYSREDLRALLIRHGAVDTVKADVVRQAGRLLESQRYMLYAYTSCAWFFSDIGGIEAVQNMRYATRALQLALVDDDFVIALKAFRARLSEGISNIGTLNGADILDREVMSQLRHIPLICFTTAAQNIIGAFDVSDSFGYELELRQIVQENLLNGVDCFVVDIDHPRSGEKGCSSVLVRHENGTRLSGCVVPFDVEKENGFAVNDVTSWMDHPLSVHLDLSDIFDESKVRLTNHYLQRIEETTLSGYLSWMISNEPVLDSLARLNSRIPAFLLGALSYLLTSQWNGAIVQLKESGTEDKVFYELDAVNKRAVRYGINIDMSSSTALIEELLRSELSLFAETLGVVPCDRMRYLLDIVDTFSLPVAKNRIEDSFMRILKSNVHTLYQEYHKADRLSAEHSEYLTSLLSFASRMNFNTDAFPL